MTEDSISVTSGIDDLVSDALGTEPSAPVEAAPAEPAATTPAEPAVSTPAEPAPQAAVASEPNAPASEPTPSYRIGTREYTAQEIQAALTTASQFPNLQNKYVEMLEQMKRQPAPQQAQQATQPQVAPAQQMAAIRAKYDPVVEQAVKDGLIERDFASLFPGMAAQMLMYRDGFVQLANQQAGVTSQLQASRQQAQSNGLMQEIGQSINNLAQSGEAFAPLKDPGKVQDFFKYIWDLNPQVGQLRQPDFFARQWAAFNYTESLKTQQNNAVAAAHAAQTRLARADATTATRPAGAMNAPAKSPLDMMVDDFYQRSL